MRWLIVVAALAIVSCSKGPDAEKRYEMVQRGGASKTELCQAGRDVANAYLVDKNEPKYREWKTRADIDCLTAQLG